MSKSSIRAAVVELALYDKGIGACVGVFTYVDPIYNGVGSVIIDSRRLAIDHNRMLVGHIVGDRVNDNLLLFQHPRKLTTLKTGKIFLTNINPSEYNKLSDFHFIINSAECFSSDGRRVGSTFCCIIR